MLRGTSVIHILSRLFAPRRVSTAHPPGRGNQIDILRAHSFSHLRAAPLPPVAMATRNVGATQTMNRQSMATSGSIIKNRHLVGPAHSRPSADAHPADGDGKTHLHSQLAQLSANLADTENLLRMTSVQAEAMRGLGSWHGGL